MLCCCSFRFVFFFFSSRRRHTRYWRDWSSDVCSSDLALRRLPAAGHVVEELLAVLGRGEDEGRGEEDRRLHGAFRQRRVVAIAEHQGLGMELPVPEPVLVIAVVRHRSLPSR